eukprot:COSAG04_NODE_1493_length_6537_cov_2.653619_6_plen_243_part_00
MVLHNARLGALGRHLAPIPPPNTTPAAAAAAGGWRDVLGRHGIAVNTLGPSFAAEVVGLAPPEDEGAPDYPEISAALQQALWQNKVLAIRGSLSTTARRPPRHPAPHPTHLPQNPPRCGSGGAVPGADPALRQAARQGRPRQGHGKVLRVRTRNSPSCKSLAGFPVHGIVRTGTRRRWARWTTAKAATPARTTVQTSTTPTHASSTSHPAAPCCTRGRCPRLAVATPASWTKPRRTSCCPKR